MAPPALETKQKRARIQSPLLDAGAPFLSSETAMKRAIVEPAVLAGTALDQLKQWLAISVPREDAPLTALLRTSLDMCEGFTGTLPLETLCEEVLTASGEWQCLGTRPVQAITAVDALALDGARIALPAEAYAIDLDAGGGGMVRLTGSVRTSRIVVRFTAGLAPDWDSLPDGLRHGIIRLAAHHYRERDRDPGMTPPTAVAALWRPWRRMRLA